MRVQLMTLGCRVNEAEIEAWARTFQHAGATLIELEPAAAPPDLIVVNTCAVTATAVRKSQRTLRRLRHQFPHACLLATGCVASLPVYAPSLQSLCDVLIPNSDKDALVTRAYQALPPPVSLHPLTMPQPQILLARGRQRAFIKIQDGCRHQCHFCITTIARGPERSRPIADIITQIQQLAAEGIHEIVLTGVHVAGYGREHNSNLMALLTAIFNDTDIPRVRLGALEPWACPASELGALFANQPRLMPQVHLPLQSGSDAVLTAMGRRGNSADYRAVVAALRRDCPALTITTDIIVGFPGETNSDWAQTIALLTHLQCSDVHGFVYSPRPGTRAATLPQRIDAITAQQRMTELQHCTAILRRTQLEQRLGQYEQVLIETRQANSAAWTGYTRSYLPVTMADTTPAAQSFSNHIVTVQLTAVSTDGQSLAGRFIELTPRGELSQPLRHHDPTTNNTQQTGTEN